MEGRAEASGISRPVHDLDNEEDVDAWVATSVKTAVDAIMAQPPARDADEILRLTQEKQAMRFCSEFFLGSQMDTLFRRSHYGGH